MPNIKSAKKRMELSQKWAARNRAAKARIRTAVRRVREAGDGETAQAHFAEAVSLIDRAARKRLMHPNRAARLKSQLQSVVGAAQAG